MKELLNEIDELLARLEDFTHGKDGEDITKTRAKIQKELGQVSVSSRCALVEIDREVLQMCIEYLVNRGIKTDLRLFPD